MQALLRSFAADLGKAVSTAVVIWTGTPRCPDCILTCGEPPRIPDCICSEGNRQRSPDCVGCQHASVAAVCLLLGVLSGALLHWLWIRGNAVVGTVTTSPSTIRSAIANSGTTLLQTITFNRLLELN